MVRVLPGRAAELGGEHDVVAAALQRLADHLLGVAVGVGGVDDVDAGVERLVDDPGRVLGVVAHGRGEHQRAEGVRADLDAGAAERAVLHGLSLVVVVGAAGMPYRKRNALSGTIRNAFPVMQAEVTRWPRTPTPGAAPAPRRRAAQRRGAARGRADGLRHLRRGRAREGDHRPGRRRASARCTGTSRSARDLVKAVVESGIDAVAEAGPALAAAVEPAEALARWIDRFTELLGTKRGLASALHSGDPAFAGLPGYFLQRLGPTLARCSTPPRPTGRSATTSTPRTSCTPSPSCASPCPGGGPSTPGGSSASSSTACAAEPGRGGRTTLLHGESPSTRRPARRRPEGAAVTATDSPATATPAAPATMRELVAELRERLGRRAAGGGGGRPRQAHRPRASCWSATGSTGCSTRAPRSWS